ncbi:Dabb family protein [Saccharothrix syringae]|uniref:Dabb family protein n=1 Tax=Saccharothrix syringae TaxID=103733 RepID=A0A5Q0H647_SACSY|nr:Dabb family protein [Saccharothrix syringae]QFZ21718.1 Dabb family protein [Saccharothrix syringae]
MIVNLLRFRFREGTTPDQEAEVLAAMRRTASLDSAAFGVVGHDIGDPAEGFTHTYLVGIPDLDALERYMHDPVHIAGDEVILPHLARLAAVRMSDDDPDVAAKVAELHLAKVAKYPEWGRAVDELMAAR